MAHDDGSVWRYGYSLRETESIAGAMCTLYALRLISSGGNRCYRFYPVMYVWRATVPA